jgi:hypothetical protein
MDGDDPNQKLGGVEARIVSTKRNSLGRVIHLVEFPSGQRIAMFRTDLIALTRGTVTLDHVVTRNKGVDLAGPWPPPAYAGRPGMRVEFRNGREVREAVRPADATLDLIAAMIRDYEDLGEQEPPEPKKVRRSAAVRRFRST